MAAEAGFVATVVCAWPERALTAQVRVSAEMTVADVVAKSGLLERLQVSTIAYGVFGRTVTPDYVVRPGGRIEVLRPLAHDPKDTRRKLAAQGRSMGARRGS